MKSTIISLMICFLAVTGLFAQQIDGQTDSVKVIKDFRNLYQYQQFYLGGQPTYEALLWLKSKGVKKIINLRADRENNEFAATAFNEESLAAQLGLEYHSLPVDGMKDYTPARLDSLASLLRSEDITLIHCMSAIRATQFFMAWLVKYRGYSLNRAVAIGKQTTFSLPIEGLLGVEILMETR
jgi:protein tyrosine phosphatase (PTP) superfamily phosphohydrolase (DUF442 family)